MKVAVAYVFPVVDVRTYFPLALRFAGTYQQFAAGHPHELWIICNGREPTRMELAPFDQIPHQTLLHDNRGWDIGGFLRLCGKTDADLLVCFGSHVHFHRPNWLSVMVSAFLSYGPGLYGCTTYYSDHDHIRTTMFWLPPELLRSYPHEVGSSRPSRYAFEHGRNSLTRHAQTHGFPAMLVTWKGCFTPDQWHDNAPGAHEVLCRDQHIHA